MVALGIARLDADEISAWAIEAKRGACACFGAGFEIELVGGFEGNGLAREIGEFFLAGFFLRCDEGMDDDVFEGFVRIDVGEHPLNLNFLSDFRADDGAGVFAPCGRSLVDKRGGRGLAIDFDVELDFGVFGARG